jgi:hypothetical protein
MPLPAGMPPSFVLSASESPDGLIHTMNWEDSVGTGDTLGGYLCGGYNWTAGGLVSPSPAFIMAPPGGQAETPPVIGASGTYWTLSGVDSNASSIIGAEYTFSAGSFSKISSGTEGGSAWAGYVAPSTILAPDAGYEIYQVADAVASDVAATSGTLGFTYTPQRIYLPFEDQVPLAAATLGPEPTYLMSPLLLVFAEKDVPDLIDRDDSGAEDIQIDLGILQTIPPTAGPLNVSGANPTIDPLMRLARNLALLYVPGDNAGSTSVQWSGISPRWPMLYSTEHLKNKRIFFSVISYMFKQFNS